MARKELANFLLTGILIVDYTHHLQMNLLGINISHEEIWVIATVIGGMFLFEAGPKLLNFLKNRRSQTK